jgi:hypothetical protein
VEQSALSFIGSWRRIAVGSSNISFRIPFADEKSPLHSRPTSESCRLAPAGQAGSPQDEHGPGDPLAHPAAADMGPDYSPLISASFQKHLAISLLASTENQQLTDVRLIVP